MVRENAGKSASQLLTRCFRAARSSTALDGPAPVPSPPPSPPDATPPPSVAPVVPPAAPQAAEAPKASDAHAPQVQLNGALTRHTPAHASVQPVGPANGAAEEEEEAARAQVEGQRQEALACVGGAAARAPRTVPHALPADAKLTLAMFAKAIAGIGEQIVRLSNEWQVEGHGRVYQYEKMADVREPPGVPLLPRHVVSLPEGEAFSSRKIGDLVCRAHVFLRSQMPFLARLDDGRDAFQDVGYDIFRAFFGDKELFPLPRGVLGEEAAFWREDECFAEQFLTGCNPTIIEKPSGGMEEVRARMPSELLAVRDGERGRSVEQLLAAGDLYWADYAVLAGERMRESVDEASGAFVNSIRFDAVGPEPPMSKFFYAPFVAFYKRTNGRLGVLGIVLVRGSGHVYNQETCCSTPNVYTFAKMHVACADNQVHQFYSHLGRCHLVFEPFGVALRNVFAFSHELAREHVVNKLLAPHFADHIAINWLARNTLIAHGDDAIAFTDSGFALGTKGGVTLLAAKYSKWRLQDQAFPAQLRARGFDPDGADGLRGYFYRDDGMLLWRAMERYVYAALRTFYSCDHGDSEDSWDSRNNEAGGDEAAMDARVRMDEVLQRWCAEMRDEQKAYVPSFPAAFTSVRELCETVTTILYNVSAEHAAVNSSQERYLTYVPNRPNALFRPVPAPGGQDMLLEKEVLGIHRMGGNEFGASLPLSFAMFQVQFAQLLTMPPTRTLMELGDLGEGYTQVSQRLQRDLERAHYIVKARNLELMHEHPDRAPYEFLDPAQVGVSIEI